MVYGVYLRIVKCMTYNFSDKFVSCESHQLAPQISESLVNLRKYSSHTWHCCRLEDWSRAPLPGSCVPLLGSNYVDVLKNGIIAPVASIPLACIVGIPTWQAMSNSLDLPASQWLSLEAAHDATGALTVPCCRRVLHVATF